MNQYTIEQVQSAVKGHQAHPLGVDQRYSVAMTLMEREGELHVLFEKRAETLKTQPGEVSFPGGGIEEEETPREAAFRETLEELRIPADNLTILQDMGFMITRYGAAIHCFLAYIEGMTMEEIKPNEAEVGSLFTVPLSYFLETEPTTYPLVFSKDDHQEYFPYELIRDDYRHQWRSVQDHIDFYRYQDGGQERVIWGFTAKMIRLVVMIFKECGL